MPLLPPIRGMPTNDLLAILLGDEPAKAFTDRSLANVFALHAGNDVARHDKSHCSSTRILEASKELLTRAIAESLQSGDSMSQPNAVKDYLRLRLAGVDHELFLVMLLDSQNRLIDTVDLFRGTLNQTSVYPREVVKLALSQNAAAVVFSHNHPSGVAEPSIADEALTRTLKSALALVDIRVLDHIIVAGTATPVSFAERGLI